MGLAVVLVSAASVSAVALTQLTGRISANAVDISNGGSADAAPEITDIGAFAGGFNLLMVGVDNTAEQAAAYGERDSTLNDVNILLHVSDDHEEAVVVSIPRDLVIAGPECTDPSGTVYSAVAAQPLYSAFGRGGLGCVVATVSELTGLPIPYAGLISFAGTVAMADAVGGVPICLDAPVYDSNTGLDLPAGTSVVSGEEALAYLRTRKGVGDGSDLSRISSQQAYMSSLMRVMKGSATFTNIPRLITLANAAASNIKLSTTLADVNTMVSLAMALKDMDLDNIVFVQYPAVENPDNHNRLVPAEGLTEELLTKIRTDQAFALGDSALGNSAELAPGAAPSPTPGSPAPAVPSDADDAGQSGTPDDSGAGVIEGVRGQTAAEETCSLAFHY